MSNEIEEEREEEIVGERTIPTVNKAQSVQSKINNTLGIAVIVLVGAGFLFWYYSHAFSKKYRIEEAKQKQLAQKMQGDGNLPRLGAVPFPAPAVPVKPPITETANVGDIFAPPPPIQQAPPNLNPNSRSEQKQKSPEQLAEERRFSGAAFIRDKSNTPRPETKTENNSTPSHSGGGLQTAQDSNNNPLGDYLKPTVTAATRAQMLPTLTYLIPKGAKGDCTLETAIDSQLPGLVTCVLAYDLFGADGKAVMLERGTTLNGEVRSTAKQGQNRIFVLWTDARTPKGVVAQLASPATDSLGRAGVTGEVDNHFWERFGAAILISVINGAVQAGSSYASSAGNNGGTSFNYNMQGANNVMTQVLRDTIHIPPTINVRQGERVQILFARDVDFRPVYDLKNQYETTAYLQ